MNDSRRTSFPAAEAVILLAFSGMALLVIPPAVALSAVGLLSLLLTAFTVISRAFMNRPERFQPGPSPARPRLTPRQLRKLPFVSIHVATHDEPPGMVCRTLRSLARLNYPPDRFEVIVLDNNTPSRDRWEPVRDYCQELGENFRFFHFEAVEGAKAGALDIALTLADRQALHISTVDADYEVHPDYLIRAVRILEDHRFSDVQFPQAYRNGHGPLRAVEAELRHYFTVFAQDAARNDGMLLTGTMCVIRRSALQAVGGWSSRTITEDAELGARLISAGFRGAYLDEVAGRGLLPESFSALTTQRFRWAAGNAQTLRFLALNPRDILSNRDTWRSAWMQLTAWLQWLSAPILILIGATLFIEEIAEGGLGWRIATGLAAGSIVLHLTGQALFFHRFVPGRLEHRMQALFVHLGLMPEALSGTVSGLFGLRVRFIRTDKEHRGHARAGFWIVPAAMSITVAAVWWALHGFLLEPIALTLLLLPLLSRVWLGELFLAGAPHPKPAAAPAPLPIPALRLRQLVRLPEMAANFRFYR